MHPPCSGNQSPRRFRLRPATMRDADAVARVWHRGWPDGHAGHVPAGLSAYRTYEDLRRRAYARWRETTVVIADERVVGFVIVVADEVEQLYVAAAARGTGAASVLLGRAEAVIAERFDVAWLAVVAGNARARRFYERNGWADAGAIDYPAATADGPFLVPTRRYDKRVTADRTAGLAPPAPT